MARSSAEGAVSGGKARSGFLRRFARVSVPVAVAAATATGLAVIQSAPAFAVDQYTLLVGVRANATRVDFPVGDYVDATVDVGTGNLSVLTSDLKLPGISRDLQLGLAFNSLLVGAPSGPSSLFLGIAGEWTDRVGNNTRVNLNADSSLSYYGPDGFQGKFVPAGSGYTAPVGLKATLTGSAGTGWIVKDHTSNEVLAFGTNQRLSTITDRNGQVTSFTWTGAKLTTITSTRSGAASRQATLGYDPSSGVLTSITQANDVSGSRSVSYGYTSGRLTSILDAAGRTTSFGYTTAGGGDDLTSITNTGGQSTTIAYNGAHQVTSVLRTNVGGANAKTRFSYASSTQTLVAGPNTDLAVAVATGPHTTYTLDASERVTTAVDPLGRSRSASYTPFADVNTTTTASGATTTTTHPSTVNGGESLTGVTGPQGATASLSYGSGAAQYLPTGGADTQGNASTTGYDTAGNPTSGGNTALAATASVTYNADGTLATSKSPSGAVTTFTEDAAKHQITGITPPAGSGRGATGLTYDGYGRLATVTDGRGAVSTYSYDNLDRTTGIAYSGGGSGGGAAVPSIGYTFDTAGNLHLRTDGTGTTTLGYDGLNRLTSRTDGAGTPVSYGYDKSGNLTAATNGFGTTTYAYDDANQLTSSMGPSSASTRFYYNADGQRTDTYWRSSAPVPPATVPATFLAHSHTDYDTTGRTARAWTSRNSSDTTRVFDTSSCYQKYVAGYACGASPTPVDTGLVQYSVDNLSTVRSDYTYDGGNRLTKVANYGGHTYDYSYDINGNRSTTKVDTVTTQSLTFNTASNQITTTGYAYDAAGNLTTDPAAGNLTYNKAGQTASRATTTTYAYAGPGQGELTHEVAPPTGTTWDYSYGRASSQGVPILESVTKNGSTAYFANDPTTGTAQEMHLASGQDAYYVRDRQGTVVAMISQASGGTLLATYAYDPYGTITVTNNIAGSVATVAINTNPYSHTGGITDPSTGWVHHGARYNDTTTGRWTTTDPLTRLANPDNANTYTYAADNPTNSVDPSGRSSYSGCLSGYGSLLIAVFAFPEGVIVSSVAGVFGLYSMTDSCPYVSPDSYNTT